MTLRQIKLKRVYRPPGSHDVKDAVVLREVLAQGVVQ
jgi:hypothetical protein